MARRGWSAGLRRGLSVLGVFLLFQPAVQLAGVVAGLLVVRGLPVEEFALYALATSALGFMVIASNLGASSALPYFFRESRRSAAMFARYYWAVESVRRLLLVVVLPLVAGAFAWMALRNGFPVLSSVLCFAAAAIDVHLLISATGCTLALRLEDRGVRAFRAELAGALVRLTLIAAALAVGWRRALPPLLAAVTGDALARALSRPGCPPRPPTAIGSERRAVWRYLAPTLPSEIFAAVQAPLILWLAAATGSTQGVAEIGALSRLAQFFALLSTLTSLVFLPRLARIEDDRLFRTRFFQFGGALAAAATGIVGVAALFPEPLLAVIGSTYTGLRREMLLSVAAAGAMVMASYGIWVNAARSWKRWQAPLAALTIVFQVAYVANLPFRETADYLWFGLWSTMLLAALQLTNAVLGCLRPSWVKW